MTLKITFSSGIKPMVSGSAPFCSRANKSATSFMGSIKEYDSDEIRDLLDAKAIAAKHELNAPGSYAPTMTSNRDKEILNSLDSQKFGFYGKDKFWTHSTRHLKDGRIKSFKDEGKIPDGKTRKEYMRELIDRRVQAFSIAGSNKENEKITLTFIYDRLSAKANIYLNTSKGINETNIAICEPNGLKYLVNEAIDSFKDVYGATIWK